MAPSLYQGVVFVLDLQVLQEDTRAFQLLEDILSVLEYSNLKAVYHIILMNTCTSYNNYKNIDFVKPLDAGGLHLLKIIKETSLCNGALWVQALEMAIEHFDSLNHHVGGKIVRRHIVFISDLKGAQKYQKHHTFSQMLKEAEIFTYFLGPDVKHLDKITGQLGNLDYSHVDKNSAEFQNIELAIDILRLAPGCIVNFDNARDVYLMSLSYYPRQIFKDNIKLCTTEIPVKVHTQFIKHKSKVTMKGSKHSCPMEFREKNNLEEIVEPHNVTSGLKLHGEFIPMPPEVNSSFKEDTPKTFAILGFALLEDFDEGVLGNGDGTKCIVAHPDDRKGFFYALVTSLANAKKCAIVSYNFRKNCALKYFVLIPKTNFLLMLAIPNYGDIKASLHFGPEQFLYSKLQEEPDQNEREKVYKFLDSIDVTGPENVLILEPKRCVAPLMHIMFHRLKNVTLSWPYNENVPEVANFFNFYKTNPDRLIMSFTNTDV